jgi:hypothetical protein
MIEIRDLPRWFAAEQAGAEALAARNPGERCRRGRLRYESPVIWSGVLLADLAASLLSAARIFFAGVKRDFVS